MRHKMCSSYSRTVQAGQGPSSLPIKAGLPGSTVHGMKANSVVFLHFTPKSWFRLQEHKAGSNHPLFPSVCLLKSLSRPLGVSGG